jgi:MFS family permease
LLDPRWFHADVGWRIGFGLGALLAIALLLVRRDVPESPRWLLVHGHGEEAERVVAGIEAVVTQQRGQLDRPDRTLAVTLRERPTLREVTHVLLRRYPKRTAAGLALMISQAFFITRYFSPTRWCLRDSRGFPRETSVATSSLSQSPIFSGPVVLGPLFDRVGRRKMIALTYGLSGAGLAATGYGFMQGWLDATTQTMCWSVVFFLASAAASSAYLTVSEVFPLEMRGLSISIFYAVGTGIGGFIAPAFFGMLIGTGSRASVFVGYATAQYSCLSQRPSRCAMASTPNASPWRKSRRR